MPGVVVPVFGGGVLLMLAHATLVAILQGVGEMARENTATAILSGSEQVWLTDATWQGYTNEFRFVALDLA